MTKCRQHRRGFTIVELLVVLGVISALMGVIVVGLRSAISTAHKTNENNNIRQLYVAWSAYTAQSNGALLPGLLEEKVLQDWKVTCRNQNGATVPDGLAQTYPYRLLPFLDSSYAMLLGYRGTATESLDTEAAAEWEPNPMIGEWMLPSFGSTGSAFTFQPAFGYNALFIGGAYTSWGGGGSSVPAYSETRWTTADGRVVTGGLVATKEANIGRPSQTLVFCSSTFRPRGLYDGSRNVEDYALGSALVYPPAGGKDTEPLWHLGLAHLQGITDSGTSTGGPAWASPTTMQVRCPSGCHVPVRRFNGQASIVHADGSTMSEGLNALVDMQRWTSAAWKPDFWQEQTAH